MAKTVLHPDSPRLAQESQETLHTVTHIDFESLFLLLEPKVHCLSLDSRLRTNKKTNPLYLLMGYVLGVNT